MTSTSHIATPGRKADFDRSRPLYYAAGFTGAIFAIAHAGFYERYIALFPSFTGVSAVTHFHATVMFSWLALLVLQPVLILNKRTALHRRIGAVTYILAPLIVLSLVLITKQAYTSRLARIGEVESLAGLSIQVPDAVAFPLLYGLAIYYRRKPAWHGRFMIATSFPIIGAALFRILTRSAGMAPPDALSVVHTAGTVTCLAFLAGDARNRIYLPYSIALAVMLAEHGVWIARYSDIWQQAARLYVRWFVA